MPSGDCDRPAVRCEWTTEPGELLFWGTAASRVMIAGERIVLLVPGQVRYISPIIQTTHRRVMHYSRRPEVDPRAVQGNHHQNFVVGGSHGTPDRLSGVF